MCDADLSHFGRKNFAEKNELLWVELEHARGKKFDDLEWTTQTIEFFTRNPFHTRYAQIELNERGRRAEAR